MLKEKQRKLNDLIAKPPKLEKERKKSENYYRARESSNRNCLEYQKNTMATLVGSIKSNGSIKKNIQEKVPIFEREYEGKKSVIVENKR